MANTILVVDDDPVQRRLLEATLVKSGYQVEKAETGEEALSLIAENRNAFSTIILDLVMPGVSGMEVLEALQNTETQTPVIVQTAQSGMETVVNAMRSGAFDFVVKPVAPDRLLKSVEKALKFEGVKKAPAKRSRSSATKFDFRNIVTKSENMRPILIMGEKAAQSNIPVLIEGESGVGKELIARASHGASERAGHPLITVNCGALPENLVESLLFGHEKGAFTGASEKHIGKFEEADGGTLFLDEVGELPLDLQVKLLRAIQEGEIDPIGAKKSLRVDVRLVSATNRDLLSEVKAGRFREDLYYRLNVLPMTIPPLRDRGADIEPLIFHFIKKIAREQSKPAIAAINPAALGALKAHSWPGNIRELENAIFRAIVLCDGEELSINDFPQVTTQLPNFSLPVEDTSAASSHEESNLQLIEAPQMTTPVSTEKSSADQNSSSKAIVSSSPATGNFGLIQMVSEEGQIKSL